MKVIKIGAVWCPGCLVMRPRWQKIEKDNEWLKTEYFDIDEYPELKEKHSLTEYPSFIWLADDGTELARLTGEISEKQIMELINKYKNN